MEGGSPLTCTEVTAQCPVEASIYGYYPNRPINAALVIVFGILMLVQGWQTFKYKTYTYSFAMTVGCLGEAIGLSRLSSSIKIFVLTRYWQVTSVE